MTLIEILREALKAHGYDGLCWEEEGCGCGIGNLFLCGCMNDLCVPAYRHADGNYYPEKEDVTP